MTSTTTATRATEIKAAIAAGTLKPYACGDQACAIREEQGSRCPWCWGGFPVR